MDIEALMREYLPAWIKKDSDREAWIETFFETYQETQNAEMASLAAEGRIKKRRILGLKSVDGEPIVAGWGLLFTGADDLDLQETYFDDDTPLLLEYYQNAPLFYEHGEDPKYGVDPIGQRTKATLYPRGVWVEHKLFSDHPFFDKTYAEAQRGELAYSSDTIGHLAEKEYDPRDGRLGWWGAAAWSLTGNPAEPALGSVTLKQFTGALKSMAREVRTQDGATQTTQAYMSLPIGAPPMPNEIYTALAAALGLSPDVTPEQLQMAVEQAISDAEASPESAMSMHTSLGGDPAAPADPASLGEKMNALYKMATEKDAAPPPPEPMPTAMNAQRNFSGLKDVALLAGKSTTYPSSMPYMVNTGKKGEPRNYSTINQNRGVKAPGVSEVFKDMVLVNRGLQPETFRSGKAMSYATGPAGGYVLEQEISDQILDPLRADTAVLQMGARQEDMDGIQIKSVPAMQTAPAAYWVGEGQTVVDSQPVYRMITLVPKPLATLVLRPFNFFKNMTPNAETQLKKEIQKSLALAIDLSALTGIGGAAASPNTGSSPRGLLNISGVTNTPLATNGRNPTLADLEGADKRLDAANIPAGGKRGWIFHSNVKHVFTGMTDANGQPIFRESWGAGADKELLGYPFAVENQIPTNITTGTNASTTYIFYGDWRFMIVGLTTTVELVLDQTYAATLNQGLLAYIYVDINIDYSEAFQTLSGVTYS